MTAVTSAYIKKKSKLVNFCVATLILKMEESNNIFSILCFIISKKDKNRTEMQKTERVCAECGEGAVTDRTCQT